MPSDPTLLAHRCEEILSIQALGLKKRLAHTHAQTAVVGISGGLDSTLALLVTARAFDLLGLDRTHIIAITMPGFGTTDRTYSNACSMVKSLGATLKEIPIGNAVLQHFSDIDHDPESHDVTYENSQARERTQILMDVANQENGLVIGTGDLSELALGWATYNGDHMSMYAVNSSVPKTLVRHLVRHYASHCDDKELSQILADVLDTPVSPELLPPSDEGAISQKTEDLVGPYELHDFFLYQLLRFGFTPGKIYRLACIASKVATTKKPLRNGSIRSIVDSLHNSSSARACRMAPRWAALPFRPVAIYVCHPMLVREHGLPKWNSCKQISVHSCVKPRFLEGN